MTVLLVLTCVAIMLLVPTPWEDTSVHVMMDTMEMDLSAIVNSMTIPTGYKINYV